MARVLYKNNLARRRIIEPGWLKPARPYLDFDFANARYFMRDTPNPFSLCAFSRATTAWYDRGDGIWIQAASGAIRITPGKGYVSEIARTNVVLQNRDLTNVLWIKSNCTAAKNQVGIDGVTNSASSLTSTSGNATCLQTTVVASSSRRQSTFIKRLTGSGNIDMTTDNGSTWTTLPVTSVWTQVQIPAQTLANPTVGFRIVTSGDAVAIDMVQNESAAAIDGMSTPIDTAAVAVTRNIDTLTLAITSMPGYNAAQGTLFGDAVFTSRPVVGAQSFASLNDGTNSNRIVIRSASTTFITGIISNAASLDANLGNGTVVAGAVHRAAMSFATNSILMSVRGGANAVASGGSDLSCNIPTITRLEFGGTAGATGNTNTMGYLARVTYWNIPLEYRQLANLVSD